MQIALLACLLYVLLILGATFSSWGILRGVNGSLMRSPFIMGILFLLSFGIGLTGMVFGFVSGRYRSDGDVIEGLTYPMKLLGVYFVIAFLPRRCSPASNIPNWTNALPLWVPICLLPYVWTACGF